MPKISDIYQSKSDFLKADDIGGDMPIVQIETAEVKDFDGGERKLVLTFHGQDKSLLLNMTNAKAIGQAYGTNTDNWIDKSIMLFTMMVDYQGKMVNAIRVRMPPSSKPGGFGSPQTQSFAQSTSLPNGRQIAPDYAD
jgi:hypothetical protein